ncbi:hypothetical protein JL722_12048 [Aureococcus anophagefferens]|nr:hypothetical protein JL722_12048 [Aureococcus anophagefferens]
MAGDHNQVECEARQQLEYYFSYANYSRDAYLRGLADGRGFVALADLEDFPKLAALLARAPGDDVLARAAATSPLLDYDAANGAVRAANLGGSDTHEAKHLVLDANAIRAAASLAGYAERFWTIEEVLAEVRDDKSREQLLRLPFELEVRRPSAEATARVLEFAKLTGDLRSLSAVDAKVLALALTLELEAVGDDAHLRRAPGGARPAPAAKPAPAPRPSSRRRPPGRAGRAGRAAREADSSAMGAADDSGVGWLDASHVATAVATGELPFDGSAPAASDGGYKPSCGCACATVDYAMQSVLLQMGLRLVSLDGMVVSRTTRWALRCGACFHVEDDQAKLFCSRCGSTPLNRVAVGVDAATGKRRVFLRKTPRHDLRGTKFALPKPGQAGRYEGELLLREDQLLSGIWRQRAARAKSAKTKQSVFGPDVTDSLEALNIVQANDLTVGLGRKNPNAMKGRERRGKSKRKH